MNTKVIVFFSLAVIAGVFFTSSIHDMRQLPAELEVASRVSAAAGFLSSGASAAAGILSAGLLQVDDVEFTQPVDHEVTLDIPPVFKCNPFDHVRLGSRSSTASRLVPARHEEHSLAMNAKAHA